MQSCYNYVKEIYFVLYGHFENKTSREELPLMCIISISYLEIFCPLKWVIIRWFDSRDIENFLFKSQYILFAYKMAHLYSTITSPEEMIFNKRIQLSSSGNNIFFRAIAAV